MPVWLTFYFNGNQIWKKIKSREDWEEVLKAYGNDITLLRRAKQGHNELSGCVGFGFYPEYNIDLTLGEWADLHSMNLDP